MMNLVLLVVVVVVVLAMVPTKGYPSYYHHRDAYVDDDIPEPSEVQSALCNIVTDQITATANATITRQLKGVCHAKDVREQLRRLEMTVTKELRKIHAVVQAISAHQTSRKSVVFKYLPSRQP